MTRIWGANEGLQFASDPHVSCGSHRQMQRQQQWLCSMRQVAQTRHEHAHVEARPDGMKVRQPLADRGLGKGDS